MEALGQLLLFDYGRFDGRCGEIRSFRPYRLEERLTCHCTNEALHLVFVVAVVRADADERVQSAGEKNRAQALAASGTRGR